MKRFTTCDALGAAILNDAVFEEDTLPVIKTVKALARLAEYEETGLEPEEIKNRMKWISVEEQLPGNEDYYLVNITSFFFSNRQYCRVSKYEGGRFRSEAGLKESRVTHWMPLPQPPKED